VRRLDGDPGGTLAADVEHDGPAPVAAIRGSPKMLRGESMELSRPAGMASIKAARRRASSLPLRITHRLVPALRL